MRTHYAFDHPGRALPRIAMVIGLHVLVLFIVLSGDHIGPSRMPKTAILLFNLPPKVVEPLPPPPPQPRQHTSKAPPQALIAAAPPHEIEVVPRTELVPTIVDNAKPVAEAGGRPDGTGSAGTGDVGAGVGGGAPVKVRAILDPANCERPRLPWSAEQRRLTGTVILAVLIDVDGKVTDARVARSSDHPVLDQTALKSALKCHFVAAKVDNVPVRSWELFRFWWGND